MFLDMVHKKLQELLVLVLIPISFIILSKAIFHSKKPLSKDKSYPDSESESDSVCLSWRLAVEANNIRGWRTVPNWCHRHVERYMTQGQYDRDAVTVVEEIIRYVDGIALSEDNMDAWILDVDDTCISNLAYYKEKRFGCEPFEGSGFVAWAKKGECPAIPAVLRLYKKLIGCGFKVFLITGRDKERLGQVTILNLAGQGFAQYEKLFMRFPEHKGVNAVTYKSNIRRQLVEEGYIIWGNVGDQWSDLQGEFVGNRTFKIPNPMYYVS